jgi:hypothetical protein
MQLSSQCKSTAVVNTGINCFIFRSPFLRLFFASSLAVALESTSTDVQAAVAEGTETESPEMIEVFKKANTLTAEFEKTEDINQSNQAILILESLLEKITPSDPGRHYVLLNLALTLRRRAEIQLSKRPLETLLELHRVLKRCLFLFRKAVSVSPASLDVKIRYLSEIGRTATLWSTLLSSHWSNQPGYVLALLAELREDRDAPYDPSVDKLGGFVFAVIMASTLSTAYGVTKQQAYRTEGREVYRHTLG